MPWRQIYDGQFWQAQVAKLYEIESIPRAFLVDGDTGMIVAADERLRGDALADTVKSSLAKKQKPAE